LYSASFLTKQSQISPSFQYVHDAVGRPKARRRPWSEAKAQLRKAGTLVWAKLEEID
jgi:hypothetical protein